MTSFKFISKISSHCLYVIYIVIWDMCTYICINAIYLKNWPFLCHKVKKRYKIITKSFRSRDQSVRSRCISHSAAQSHVAYSVQCIRAPWSRFTRTNNTSSLFTLKINKIHVSHGIKCFQLSYITLLLLMVPTCIIINCIYVHMVLWIISSITGIC